MIKGLNIHYLFPRVIIVSLHCGVVVRLKQGVNCGGQGVNCGGAGVNCGGQGAIYFKLACIFWLLIKKSHRTLMKL